MRKNEKKVNKFFQYERKVFYNYQDLDFTGLKGRLLSASYIPLEEGLNYEKMLKDLKIIFDDNEEDGKVRIEYDTEILYGQID